MCTFRARAKCVPLEPEPASQVISVGSTNRARFFLYYTNTALIYDDYVTSRDCYLDYDDVVILLLNSRIQQCVPVSYRYVHLYEYSQASVNL